MLAVPLKRLSHRRVSGCPASAKSGSLTSGVAASAAGDAPESAGAPVSGLGSTPDGRR